MGEVTGFQKRAGGKSGLFKVPKDGQIVAWSLDLSHPDKSEQRYFREHSGDRGFNGDPTARLAILNHLKGAKFKLKASSPVVKLEKLLGRQQIFTLTDPIPVKKGWTVGITTKTWIPNFAHDLGNNDLWQASRAHGRCSGRKNLEERSHPHGKVGTTRVYGCSYRAARLLYWAYFVPA
jgi:hypothetical protein